LYVKKEPNVSKKIFSPKELAPFKVKLPSDQMTAIIPDKDNGNRLSIVHSNGKINNIEDSFRIDRSNKDADGIFTTVSYYDENDVLRKESILSKSGTNPNPDVYDVRTVKYYNALAIETCVEVYTLLYDVDGDWTSEVLA